MAHCSSVARSRQPISFAATAPYSPELNAPENICQYLRQNYLAGRITSIAHRPWLNRHRVVGINAQENISQYLRQNFLAGRIFETCDDIVDACCNPRNALTTEANRIVAIATRDWLS